MDYNILQFDVRVFEIEVGVHNKYEFLILPNHVPVSIAPSGDSPAELEAMKFVKQVGHWGRDCTWNSWRSFTSIRSFLLP